MFVLAHLSDPHLGLVAAPRLRELVGKRITGFINLTRNRTRNHQAWVLDALIEDLRAQGPDHIAVTGDLVNIALRSEFVRAREWLEGLGDPARVSLVPGNHDAYVDLPVEAGMGQWAAYMSGDDHRGGGLHFPYVRRRAHVAIIGVSSAISTAPLMATGRIGRDQLQRLGAVLSDLERERRFRVVLIHHPPVPGASSRHKRLTDARKFCRLIGQCGAELILHGHNHTDMRHSLPGPHGAVPVIGVPAASSAGLEGHTPAQYNLVRIRAGGPAVRCELIARRLDPATRTFFTAHVSQLDAATAAAMAPQFATGSEATVT